MHNKHVKTKKLFIISRTGATISQRKALTRYGIKINDLENLTL